MPDRAAASGEPLGAKGRMRFGDIWVSNRDAARKWVLERIERRRESFGTFVLRPLPPSLPVAT